MGYVGWLGTFEGIKDDPRKGKFESEMVRELRECGAVLYCKTSVPHTLMSGETVNNIIGGSSGGEGALIGFRGSPVGLGTDIGGSVRIPAGFNGLYGLRPSSGRLPYEGAANSMDGQNTVLSVIGPLATSIGGLKLITKAILSASPWLHDPLVVDMPWRGVEEDAVYQIVKGASSRKFAFGFFISDGIVTPQPPVSRAVTLVVEALRKAGHDIIEWKPPSHAVGNALVLKSWLYDGGKDIHGAFGLSGEELAPQIGVIYGSGISEESTASQISANNIAKRRWQKEYLDYWNSTSAQTSSGLPVDGVICPLAPYPAARPNTYKYYGYTMFVNGLDYTSLAVPVTAADKNVDKYPDGYEPMNNDDKAAFDAYDGEIFDGAHVSVQVVGRRYTEEKMIAIVEYIESLLA
jgi:amidase